MKEGAWINSRTGQFAWIDEHASWIRREPNAESIGLPKRVYEAILEMNWDFDGPGRAEILATVMRVGFIRMRGHGSYWTFEFTLRSADALKACQKFLDDFAGPFTTCRFNNLRTGEQMELSYQDFKETMNQGEPEKILRVARKMNDAEYPSERKSSFVG